MMKQFIKIFLLLLLPVFASGQTKYEIDNLRHELAIAKDDTSRVLILSDLSWMCLYLDYVSYEKYCREGLALAQKINFSKGEIRIQNQICTGLQIQSEVPKSFEILFKELQITEEKRYLFEKAMTLNNIGNGYYFLSDFFKALTFYRRANQAIEGTQNKPEVIELKNLICLNIGQSYNEMNQLDSAFYYLQESYKATLNSEFWHPVSLYLFSDCLFKRGEHKKALEYIHQSLELTDKSGDRFTNADACTYIARFFKELSQPDSVIYYAKKGLANSKAADFKIGIVKTSKLLAELYLPKDAKVANAYLQLAMSANDEIYGAKKVQDLQKAISDEQER